MTNDNPTHPFTLTILPNPMLSGHFDWAIRKHGIAHIFKPAKVDQGRQRALRLGRKPQGGFAHDALSLL